LLHRKIRKPALKKGTSTEPPVDKQSGRTF